MKKNVKTQFACLSSALIYSLLNYAPALAIPQKATPVIRGNAFAQLSSAIDQNPGGFVKFELQDSLQTMSATVNSVTTQQSGTYLVISSPQVTALKDGACLDSWLVVNGEDVKNSSTRLCQAKAGNTNVLVSQAVLHLNKGDKIQVKTNGKDVRLDAISPSRGPLIPSIIFSVLGLF